MSQPTTIDRLWSLIRQLQGALRGQRYVGGIVDATSGTPAIVAGTGFSVIDNGVGDYIVVFDPVFAGIPTVTVTAHKAAGAATTGEAKLHPGSDPAPNAVRIEGRRGDTLAALDISFHFHAFGPA